MMSDLEKVNFISLRFSGNDVAPTNTRCKDLASVISAAEDLVAELQNSGFDDDEDDEGGTPLCLADLHEGSLVLKFTTVNVGLALAGWHFLAGVVNTGRYEEMSPKAMSSFGDIVAFVKKRNCSAEIGDDSNKVLASFNHAISLPEQVKVKGRTSILGEVVRVGGSEPKVRIKLSTGKAVTCETTATIAKALGHRLYDRVSCKGHAVWDFGTSEMLSFRIDEVSEFSRSSLSGSLKELADAMPLTVANWRKRGLKTVIESMKAE